MSHPQTEPELPVEDQYPKLVRDRIPELIEGQGKMVETRVLTEDAEYLGFLMAKLIEEATELAHAEGEDQQREEIADVREVLKAIFSLKHLTDDEINAIQDDKRQKRGGFEERILMIAKPEGEE